MKRSCQRHTTCFALPDWRITSLVPQPSAVARMILARQIELSAAERRELEALARRRKTAKGLARRAQIVLGAAEGLEDKAIATVLGADQNTVGKWRRRFAERQMAGLYDEPRPGAPRQIGDDEIAETIRLTLETTPPGPTHWSLCSMAAAVGHAPSTIHRMWKF